MAERGKIKAAGNHGANALPGDSGIDPVLAQRKNHDIIKMGYGRIVTTVGSLPEIVDKIEEGYDVLWCQMSKVVPSDTGETR